MTKEEIYKASDVLNTILDNYLHGGEAAEVVTKFEDELIKLNLTKEKPVSEDLGDYINELSKQFSEVSFAKLSRIAVRVAKWQKEQIMKDAVEGEIVKDSANNLYIGKAKVNKNNFKFGDKVKLLVLKEE